MTEDTMALHGLREKSSDADLLREMMIGFAGQRQSLSTAREVPLQGGGVRLSLSLTLSEATQAGTDAMRRVNGRAVSAGNSRSFLSSKRLQRMANFGRLGLMSDDGSRN